jgi:hypothetical protein
MTGRKTLGEVRAELEAALGAGPAGDGEVAESLRRFLAAGSGGQSTPNQALDLTDGASQVSGSSQPTDAPPASDGKGRHRPGR